MRQMCRNESIGPQRVAALQSSHPLEHSESVAHEGLKDLLTPHSQPSQSDTGQLQPEGEIRSGLRDRVLVQQIPNTCATKEMTCR